jgi:hypothetical protein
VLAVSLGLTKFLNISVSFFLINNNHVNAKFLSRFIARKLKQGYPVKELLSPLRKEWSYLIKITRVPTTNYYKGHLKEYHDTKNNYNTKIRFLENFYKYFIYKYKMIRKLYYDQENMYMSIHMLIILI